MVSLVSVHDTGSLFYVYGLLYFSLVPLGFTGHCCVLHGHSVLWPGNDLLLLLLYPGLCVL